MNKIMKIGGAVLVLFIAIFAIYQIFIKEEEIKLDLEKVFRGDVYQEIAETGEVEIGEEIALAFEVFGLIETVNVEVGDTVKRGEFLAKVDREQIEIELQKAIIRLDLLKSQAKTSKIALSTTQQTEKDTISQTNANINRAYETALNSLIASELAISNAFNDVELIQRTYFFNNSQNSIRVRTNKKRIKKSLNNARRYLDLIKIGQNRENIDIGLLEMENSLNLSLLALNTIEEIIQQARHRYIISAITKTSLNAHQENIIRSLTSLVNSQQLILTTQATSQTKINQAISQVEIKERKIIDDDLLIKQGYAQVEFLNNRLRKTSLYSPVAGKIIKVDKSKGEIVQPGLPILSIRSDEQPEIVVNIYEEDVVKIKIGNLVKIELIAFPGQELKGEVVFIDPTETLVGGVVHYKVTIAFIDDLPKGIRSGMSADIIIKPNFRENVLIVDEDAIIERDNRYFVEIYQTGKIQEREIQIGLRGERDRVEIISGLKQGEQVIVR